jgi:hypothetical protein
VNCPEAVADFSLFGALFGKHDMDIRASRVEMIVVADALGRSNLMAIFPEPKEAGGGGGGDGGEPAVQEEMPDFRMVLHVDESRVIFRDGDAESHLTKVDLKIDLPSIYREATASLSFKLPGKGKGSADATFVFADMTGTAEWNATAPSLRELTPAAAVFAEIDSLEGKGSLRGTAAVTKHPALKVDQTVTLEELEVSGSLVGSQAIRVPSAMSTLKLDLDEEGKGPLKVDAKLGTAGSVGLDSTITPVSDTEVDWAGTVTIEGDLRELTAQVAGLLRLQRGYRLDGELDGGLTFTVRIEGWTPLAAAFSLDGGGRSLAVIEPDGSFNPISAGAQLKTSGAWEKKSGLLDVSELKATIGSLSLSGRLQMIGDRIEDSNLEAEAELGRFLDEIRGFVDLRSFLRLDPEAVIEGGVALKTHFTSGTDGIEVESTMRLEGLWMGVGAQQSAELHIEGVVDVEAESMAVRTATIDSSFAKGTASGTLSWGRLDDVEFDLAYVPEKLDLLLRPWLGRLSLVGADERRISGSFSGSGEELLEVLRTGSGKAGGVFGRLKAEGFAMEAQAKLDVRDGKVTFGGPADINYGRARVRFDFDARKKTGTFAASAQGVELSAENGNLLALIHPIFHQAVRIDGWLETRLDGALHPEDGLYMDGSLEINDFAASGSPFLTAVLNEMGISGAALEGHLKLPRFEVIEGTVRYERLEIKLEHSVLVFSGKIDFSQVTDLGKLDLATLDLVMDAPLRRSWLKKLGLDAEEREWVGRRVRIPVTGTVTSPKFDFKTPLKELIEKILKKKTEKKAKEKLEDWLKEKFRR